LNFVAVPLRNLFSIIENRQKNRHLSRRSPCRGVRRDHCVGYSSSKDRIIHQFIEEANKSLSTPVRIGKINVSSWNDFPTSPS